MMYDSIFHQANVYGIENFNVDCLCYLAEYFNQLAIWMGNLGEFYDVYY